MYIPLLGEGLDVMLVDSTQISQPIDVIFEVWDLKDDGLYQCNRHTHIHIHEPTIDFSKLCSMVRENDIFFLVMVRENIISFEKVRGSQGFFYFEKLYQSCRVHFVEAGPRESLQ